MEKKRKKTIVFCTVFAVTLFVVLVSVASCQIVNKGKEKPDPYIPKKLEDVIKTRNLGILESANETTVKSKLVEKNPELKEEYIKVEVTMAKAIETTNYIVKVSSTNPDIYIGEVTDVKFATETVVADHLDVTPILDKIAKLENQNFKDESALKNEIDGLIENELITAKVTEIAKSRAISKHSYQVDLSSTSEMLILDNNESLTISVTFGQADNLSDVITNRDLGKLENSNQETVVNKLVEKNSELKKEYIKVEITTVKATETTNYIVKVSSTNPDIYSGEVSDVKFFTEKKSYQGGLTHYIDVTTNEVKTVQGPAPYGVTEITQIGYDSNFKAYQMPSTIVKVPNWISSEITSLKAMFDSCQNFNQSISTWDVSNVTDMSYMFSRAEKFNKNISTWNVSNVTNMTYMFHSAKNFKQDLSTWNVSNVTDMSYMFYEALIFNDDLSTWNVSNVTNMNSMFAYTQKFNQDLSNWDVSSVTIMASMFFRAQVFNQDISKWDVSNVTNMYGMFYEAISFNKALSNWDVSNVTDMNSMFYGAKIFNQDLSSWVVSNVTNMSYMFFNAEKFNQNISNWNVLNVNKYENFNTNANSKWVANTAYQPKFKQ